MAIIGVKEVVYAVDDMEKCARFWTDFGLAPVAGGRDEARFETEEGSAIVLRHTGDPSLPPAPVADPTARLIVWGASDPADLDAVADRLAAAGVRVERPDGDVVACDPGGYTFAVRHWERRASSSAATRFNAPGLPNRVNQPAPAYSRAHPGHLAHVVLLCPDLQPMIDFYRELLGFKLTDSYPGFSCFLRCPGATDHHNLYLLNRGDADGFHHISFDLRDMHELFGGGLAMQEKGWQTHLGPGRHPTSSAYFWYFVNPCGGAAEYDFDADVVTDEWQPREMVPSPELFAEWALKAGIVRFAAEQKTRVGAQESTS